ncbi:uncharacterized protein LOC131934799 [Physella acuta]|uniref:uncharacterized protein LOC131934799 n=1 Tax=Physella acuta TaxID=109671 RepID=UPI0027DE0CF1|nr:uncharacterized protein LOC131934799 [Physella acuta]
MVFNDTYPANESVWIIFLHKCAFEGTDNDTIKRYRDHQFQFEHLDRVISIGFNFTVHETKGVSAEYVQLIVTITETNDTELELVLTSDSDEVGIYFMLRTVDGTGRNKPRLHNETAGTHAGSFEKFHINQIDAQIGLLTLKTSDRSGTCIILNGNLTIRIDMKPISLFKILLAVIVVAYFILTIYLLMPRRRWNPRLANRRIQLVVRHPPPAPAG